MTFQDPSFLAFGLGLTVLIVVGFLSHVRRRRRLAEFLGGPRAAERLSGSNLYRLRPERLILLGIGGLALAIAAAEPRWSESPDPGPPVNRVILAVDVSASMQATDVSPTRLAQAVGVAAMLIDALEGHRVGLMLFAGTGYALAPPTHDHKALRYLLTGITPTIASALDPGTLVSVAIEEAVGLLEREGRLDLERGDLDLMSDLEEGREAVGERHIVLIGDGETGENDENVSAAVATALAAGVGIYTVGIGTPDGAGMMMPAGTYQLGGPVVDATGARGTSRLREPLLRDVASEAGGRYTRADSEGQLEGLGQDLAEADPIAELSPDEALPIWVRYDVPFVLGLTALLMILTESLLDLVSRGLGLVRIRRPA